MPIDDIIVLIKPLLPYDIPVEPSSWGSGCVSVGGSYAIAAATQVQRYEKVLLDRFEDDEGALLTSALHEVGHTWVEDTDPVLERDMLYTTPAVLHNEALAWHWALDYAEAHGIELDIPHARWAFSTYRDDMRPQQRDNVSSEVTRLYERFDHAERNA